MRNTTAVIIATGQEGGADSKVSNFENSVTYTVFEVGPDGQCEEKKVMHSQHSNASEAGGIIKKALLIVKESPDVVIAESFSSNVLTTLKLAGIQSKSCPPISARQALNKFYQDELSSPVTRTEAERSNHETGLRADTGGGLIQRLLNVMGAKLNRWLDHLEEPEEQLAYMEKKLQERRKKIDLAIRDVIADRNLIQRKLKESQEEMGSSLRRKLEQADRRLEVLKEKRQALIKKMEKMGPRMEELRSEWKATKAENKIAEALYGLEGDFGDLDSTLDRIEEKIKKRKALADASADMMEETYQDEVIEIESETGDSEENGKE